MCIQFSNLFRTTISYRTLYLMSESKKNGFPSGTGKNKLKLAHQLKNNLKEKENISFIPSPLTTPILIRYIDPRLVPLLVQLGKLSRMVENFAAKNNVSESPDQQEEIEELVRSSKDLSAKMSAIMQENQVGFSSTGPPTLSAQKVSSQFKYVPAEETLEKSIKSFKDLSLEDDNIDMIDVLNRVSVRMEELQQENIALKTQLEQALTQIQDLKKEKEELKNHSKLNEVKYRQVLQGVKGEMQNLLLNRQSIGSSIDKVQNWLEVTYKEEHS